MPVSFISQRKKGVGFSKGKDLEDGMIMIENDAFGAIHDLNLSSLSFFFSFFFFPVYLSKCYKILLTNLLLDYIFFLYPSCL